MQPIPKTDGASPVRLSFLSRSRATLLAGFAVLLIPAILALVYLTHNNHLPESDGASFLIYGFRVYERFLHGGIREGLHLRFRQWGEEVGGKPGASSAAHGLYAPRNGLQG